MIYPYYQNYQNYNPNYYQQLQSANQPQQQGQQIQNGGFVFVKDINEAMNYPVALGNSVTFKNESQPYIYTKTLGFSQLDQPIFEVFRLVKEDKSPVKEESASEETVVEPAPTIEYMTAEAGNELKAENRNLIAENEEIKIQLANLKEEVEFLREYIESDKKESGSDVKHSDVV